MKGSFLAAFLAAGSFVTSSPVTKRDTAITDAVRLDERELETREGKSPQCAWPSARPVTRPHDRLLINRRNSEYTFYREGLANYTQAQFVSAGFPDPFYANLKEVSQDETTHVSFLTTALGASAVKACTYSFPSTDVSSFVALASVLEGVGVSAYLGAAASIMEKAYLTAAGSILTIEARHSSYIRAALKEVPFPTPFDAPLDFDEVFTLAAQFIVSCPSTNAALPVKAFPTLSLNTPNVIQSGETIRLWTTGKWGAGAVYGAFITVTGPIFVPATMTTGGFYVTVPKGVSGQTYVVITTSNTAPTDDNIIAGPAILEITKL